MSIFVFATWLLSQFVILVLMLQYNRASNLTQFLMILTIAHTPTKGVALDVCAVIYFLTLNKSQKQEDCEDYGGHANC